MSQCLCTTNPYCTSPVSYTHLDVYKRQPMLFLWLLNHVSDNPLMRHPVSSKDCTIISLLNLIVISGHFNTCLLIISSSSCSRSFRKSGSNIFTFSLGSKSFKISILFSRLTYFFFAVVTVTVRFRGGVIDRSIRARFPWRKLHSVDTVSYTHLRLLS